MPLERRAKVVILAGLSGSGKSAVGNALARQLRVKLIDTDTMIARREHMSIRALFERKGEKYFRRRESEFLLELCSDLKRTGRRAVVSLGGGALLNPSLAKRIKNCGTMVFLQIACEEAARRLLKSDTRPLILDHAGRELSRTRLTIRLRELLRSRRSGFALADYRIRVKRSTPQEICAQILESIS